MVENKKLYRLIVLDWTLRSENNIFLEERKKWWNFQCKNVWNRVAKIFENCDTNFFLRYQKINFAIPAILSTLFSRYQNSMKNLIKVLFSSQTLLKSFLACSFTLNYLREEPKALRLNLTSKRDQHQAQAKLLSTVDSFLFPLFRMRNTAEVASKSSNGHLAYSIRH